MSKKYGERKDGNCIAYLIIFIKDFTKSKSKFNKSKQNAKIFLINLTGMKDLKVSYLRTCTKQILLKNGQRKNIPNTQTVLGNYFWHKNW